MSSCWQESGTYTRTPHSVNVDPLLGAKNSHPFERGHCFCSSFFVFLTLFRAPADGVSSSASRVLLLLFSLAFSHDADKDRLRRCYLFGGFRCAPFLLVRFRSRPVCVSLSSTSPLLSYFRFFVVVVNAWLLFSQRANTFTPGAEYAKLQQVHLFL